MCCPDPVLGGGGYLNETASLNGFSRVCKLIIIPSIHAYVPFWWKIITSLCYYESVSFFQLFTNCLIPSSEVTYSTRSKLCAVHIKQFFCTSPVVAIRMGRPKKSKLTKKAGKKFEQTTSIVSNYYNNSSGTSNTSNNMNDENGNNNEKYGRIQLQRNLGNSYRSMYESKINSLHEYYSDTVSTYNTPYQGNKLNTNAFSPPVHQNSEFYNAYRNRTDGINGRSFEHIGNNNYLTTEGNPSKQYEAVRSASELPIYHSYRQQTLADSRPLVIDTHTHVTISERKYVSDTRMVVSNPYDSGTESPMGTASNYSVVGTHGSESNYDTEEDLDVILTSIEEQANQEQSSDDQQVQNWISQNNAPVKNELCPNDVISCKRPNGSGTPVPSGQMTTRDEQYWHQYHGCNYGIGCSTYPEEYPRSDGFQNHHDQTVGCQDSSPPQYHGDSSPAPQGLSSHMYNSLLMAYNCSNYQDNSAIDYNHGRYNSAMPLTHSSGPVCV